MLVNIRQVKARERTENTKAKIRCVQKLYHYRQGNAFYDYSGRSIYHLISLKMHRMTWSDMVMFIYPTHQHQDCHFNSRNMVHPTLLPTMFLWLSNVQIYRNPRERP